MSERALISFERPIKTFHGARAEEEDDGEAVEAQEAVVAEEDVEAVVAVVGDWRGPPEDTRMKIKPFAIDFITGGIPTTATTAPINARLGERAYVAELCHDQDLSAGSGMTIVAA